jgi:hypothetical protein
MPEQAISTPARAEDGGEQDVSELREELARSREEVLRLRDLLVGKDAELGTLRGKLAELEGGAAPLVAIAARLRSLVPGSLASALAGLRGRRRRQG